jgi:hypothetical protein
VRRVRRQLHPMARRVSLGWREVECNAPGVRATVRRMGPRVRGWGGVCGGWSVLGVARGRPRASWAGLRAEWAGLRAVWAGLRQACADSGSARRGAGAQCDHLLVEWDVSRAEDGGLRQSWAASRAAWTHPRTAWGHAHTV